MIQRRELFSSLASSFKKEKQESFDIRPPYSNDKFTFEKECFKCSGVCKNVCDENIIVIKDDKTPVLDFTKGGCTYCDECAKVCNFGVLDIKNKKYINAKVVINMLKCLSWNKTMCFSCKELCLDNAISFFGLFRPEIRYGKCTNCGFCVKVCPTNAIEVKKWQ